MTQKREHHREHDRVGQRRRDTRLSRADETTRTWWDGQEETWAERREEHRRHNQIGLRQHETHRFGDETVHEEEHERVEHSGHLTGLTGHKLDVFARGGQENTWAEREKKRRWDSNFLGGNIGEHC